MNENATFLSGVVSQLNQHFQQDYSPFDYHLDFIKTICDFPVNVFIKFSPMNESTHFTTYSLYIIHPKLKVCLCGDRYILYFKNYGGIRLNNITNQTIFDIFYRITNEIPLLRFDIAKGVLTLEPLITEQLVFFNKLILIATNITCLYNEECCVCYNKTQTQIKCGHICCIACLSKLNDKKCPICRIRLTTVNVPENLTLGYRKRFFGSVECESGSDNSENEEEEDGEPNIANYIPDAIEVEGSNNPANYPRVIPANSRILIMDSQIPEDTQYGRNAMLNSLRNAIDTAIQEDDLLFQINPFQDRDELYNAGVYDAPMYSSIDRIDNYNEIEPTANDTIELDTNLDDEENERICMGEEDRRA